MLDVIYQADSICIGQRLAVSFHRTLRIPEDGKTYPLPPGLGRFPVIRLGKGSESDPAVIPMYQREALWIGFSAAAWKPNALKIIIGGINAISGKPDDGVGLSEHQDYVVCPDQPWLDGVNAGGGVIRQFVAMPLGHGYAIEAAYGGTEEVGGIDLIAFEPKPGIFPDTPPPQKPTGRLKFHAPRSSEAEPREMALGAGGTMRQKIYPDRYGLDVWDPDSYGRARVAIVNSAAFRAIAGMAPPETPIDAATYTEHGLPWFDLYDESKGAVEPDTGATRVKTISERDAERGVSPAAEPVAEPEVHVIDDTGKRST